MERLTSLLCDVSASPRPSQAFGRLMDDHTLSEILLDLTKEETLSLLEDLHTIFRNKELQFMQSIIFFHDKNRHFQSQAAMGILIDSSPNHFYVFDLYKNDLDKEIVVELVTNSWLGAKAKADYLSYLNMLYIDSDSSFLTHLRGLEEHWLTRAELEIDL